MKWLKIYSNVTYGRGNLNLMNPCKKKKVNMVEKA